MLKRFLRIIYIEALYFLLFFMGTVTAYAAALPEISIPYFGDTVRTKESTIFWYGKVTPSDNYTDVRAGYTTTDLSIKTHVFDRQMWYQQNGITPDSLSQWDAVSLYLVPDNGSGSMYRFTAQVNHWQSRTNYQAAWENTGNGWIVSPIPFTATSGWRGSSPNDNATDERGWNISFTIPFSSLNLQNSPHGAQWKVALITHDRDDPAQAVRSIAWPEGVNLADSTTWGNVIFGLTTYGTPAVTNTATATIRHNLNGAVMTDASVGGRTVCGDPFNPDFFNGWGDATEDDYTPNHISQINIQNQTDVADWPCFSKFYVTFPLDQIPAGKKIVSATLTMHEFGGSNPSQATPSFIQVQSVLDPWSSSSITWNNAPLVYKTVARTMVNVYNKPLVWPGDPYSWDVSSAVSESYEIGLPVRLVLYSADSDYHSGKYFSSSDTGDWNAVARPTLDIVWGDPMSNSIPGDIDGDGDVDLLDLATLLTNFGKSGISLPGNVDGDNDVDLADLTTLLSNFGR
ncbi:DNRLRE domain-containing protein [Candidatus Roizmanbacteria bacterium]|nr:DNRLRE domain-containing protein [Candidatus Roizmanbacteria bacterium]